VIINSITSLSILEFLGNQVELLLPDGDLLVKDCEFFSGSLGEDVLVDEVDLLFPILLASQEFLLREVVEQLLRLCFLDPAMKIVEDVLEGVRPILLKRDLTEKSIPSPCIQQSPSSPENQKASLSWAQP